MMLPRHRRIAHQIVRGSRRAAALGTKYAITGQSGKCGTRRWLRMIVVTTSYTIIWECIIMNHAMVSVAGGWDRRSPGGWGPNCNHNSRSHKYLPASFKECQKATKAKTLVFFGGRILVCRGHCWCDSSGRWNQEAIIFANKNSWSSRQ